MAHHKSCIKRIRTSAKARNLNRHYKSMMRTMIKKVRETEEAETREKLFRQTSSILDKMVSKRIIHRNNAANKKSRLAKLMLSSAPPAE